MRTVTKEHPYTVFVKIENMAPVQLGEMLRKGDLKLPRILREEVHIVGIIQMKSKVEKIHRKRMNRKVTM